MSPRDIWWMIEAIRPRKLYGKGKNAISEDDVEDLCREMFPEEYAQ